MSVTVYKILGYSMDVQKEWESLNENEQDKAIERARGASKIFRDFLGDYDRDKVGKIQFIDDGMSGDYTKLVHLLSYAVDVSDDDEIVIKATNEQLKNVEVPSDIIDEILNVYEAMFGVKGDGKNIHVELFLHYT